MTSDNVQIKSSNFNVDKNGNMTCSNAVFNGGNIELYKEDQHAVFGIYTDKTNNPQFRMFVFDESVESYNYGNKLFFLGTIKDIWGNVKGAGLDLSNSSGDIKVSLNGTDGDIRCVSLTQTSLVTEKKNFEKFQNALEILKDIDIYRYNLKHEEDGEKKHIGFVIGDNFKYSKEVTSKKNDGVDLYSFVSLCCKAIQEQQVKIEKLEQEIKTLKEEK